MTETSGTSSPTRKKKKKAISYTQLTLKWLRKEGYFCGIAEHWNAWAGIRQDLFGFIDIVALGEGRLIGVQSTVGGSHAARRNKILSLESAARWQTAGGEIWIVSWTKDGRRWAPRVEVMECISITPTS